MLLKELSSMTIPDLVGDRTVILVDDNPDSIWVYRRILKSLGITNIESAGSADDARKIARKLGGNIAAVITDDGLPGESGEELENAILKGNVEGLPSDTAILMITGGSKTGRNRIIKGANTETQITEITAKLLEGLIQQRYHRETGAILSEEELNAIHDPALLDELRRQEEKGLISSLHYTEQLVLPPADYRNPRHATYLETDGDYMNSLKSRDRHTRDAEKTMQRLEKTTGWQGREDTLKQRTRRTKRLQGYRVAPTDFTSVPEITFSPLTVKEIHTLESHLLEPFHEVADSITALNLALDIHHRMGKQNLLMASTPALGINNASSAVRRTLEDLMDDAGIKYEIHEGHHGGAHYRLLADGLTPEMLHKLKNDVEIETARITESIEIMKQRDTRGPSHSR